MKIDLSNGIIEIDWKAVAAIAIVVVGYVLIKMV